MSDNIVKTPSLPARRKSGSNILNTKEFKEVEFGDGFTIDFVEIPQPNPHDLKVPMKSHTVMRVSVSGIESAGGVTEAWVNGQLVTTSGNIIEETLYFALGLLNQVQAEIVTTSGDIVAQIGSPTGSGCDLIEPMDMIMGPPPPPPS